MSYSRSDGRCFIRRPGHPSADKRGYVLRYRIVYEEFYKCCLLSYTVIHHTNGDPTDDRIENLRPMWNGRHMSLENKGARRIVPGSRNCIDCDSTATYADPDGNANWSKVSEGEYRCYRCARRLRYITEGR